MVSRERGHRVDQILQTNLTILPRNERETRVTAVRCNTRQVDGRTSARGGYSSYTPCSLTHSRHPVYKLAQSSPIAKVLDYRLVSESRGRSIGTCRPVSELPPSLGFLILSVRVPGREAASPPDYYRCKRHITPAGWPAFIAGDSA